MERRFEAEIDQHRHARYNTYRLVALQHPVVGIIEVLGFATVLVLAAIRISSGDLAVPDLITYLTGLVLLIDPIAHVTANYNEFQQGQSSLRRLREIEKEPSEPADPVPSIALGRLRGDLKFDQVEFAYTEGQPVLQDFNLNIKAGQVVALVGPSGAGKTTLFFSATAV